MATNSPQDDWYKGAIRLPRDLHRRLTEAAAVSGRSLNSEIISRLEHTFSDKTINGVSMEQLFVMMEELRDMVQSGKYREFSASAQRSAEALDPPKKGKR